MHNNIFLDTMMEGAEQIISSDKPCADILNWANKEAGDHGGEVNISRIAAYFLLGIKSEISARVSKLRHLQQLYYDGDPSSDRELIYEKNDLWDLEEQISDLLLKIVKMVAGSDGEYLEMINSNEEVDYRGAYFRPETGQTIKRYLEATMMLLNSINEQDMALNDRHIYLSRILRAFEYDPEINETFDDHTKNRLINPLGMLKEMTLVKFDGHIPLITENSIEFFTKLFQDQATKILDKQIKMSTDDVVYNLKDIAFLESDNETITKEGMQFLTALSANATPSNSFPVSSVSSDAPPDLNERGARAFLESLFQAAKKKGEGDFITGMLAVANNIDGIENIVIGWISHKTTIDPEFLNLHRNKIAKNTTLVLNLLARTDFVTIEDEDMAVSDGFSDLLVRICQHQVADNFPSIVNEVQVTEEEAITVFGDMEIIDANSGKLTRKGIAFLYYLASEALESPSTSIQPSQAEDDFVERLTAAMLEQSSNIDDIDAIALGWIAQKFGEGE